MKSDIEKLKVPKNLKDNYLNIVMFLFMFNCEGDIEVLLRIRKLSTHCVRTYAILGLKSVFLIKSISNYTELL